MNLVYDNPIEESKIVLTNFTCADGRSLLKDADLYKIIWAKDAPLKVLIDGCYTTLEKDQLLYCTPLNLIKLFDAESSIISIVFNREFYCIRDNDEEVSCNGFLFYGSSNPVIITIGQKEIHSIKEIYRNFEEEFHIEDKLQGEMIRSILKRLLITTHRLLDKKAMENDLNNSEKDIIRKFNILVEKNFRTLHKVTEYAKLLSKSPKTLGNVFSKHSQTTPLMVINDRILLEARRLLLFSEKPIKEIAIELGYNYESHFSSFFKTNKGSSPIQFRKEFETSVQGNNP